MINYVYRMICVCGCLCVAHDLWKIIVLSCNAKNYNLGQNDTRFKMLLPSGGGDDDDDVG